MVKSWCASWWKTKFWTMSKELLSTNDGCISAENCILKSNVGDKSRFEYKYNLIQHFQKCLKESNNHESLTISSWGSQTWMTYSNWMR
jgi:hypothetical protein